MVDFIHGRHSGGSFMDVVSSVFGKAFSGCCRSFQSQCGEVSWRELMDFKQVLFIRVYLIY